MVGTNDYDDTLVDPSDHEWCEMHEHYKPCKLCRMEAEEERFDRQREDQHD